jgi:hypothetical protein
MIRSLLINPCITFIKSKCTMKEMTSNPTKNSSDLKQRLNLFLKSFYRLTCKGNLKSFTFQSEDSKCIRNARKRREQNL